MRLLTKILLWSLFIFISISTDAQYNNIEKYAEEAGPAIFISFNGANKENILFELRKSINERHLKYHLVILVPNNIGDLNKSINNYLNKESCFDKSQLYFLFVGNASTKPIFDSLDKKIFADTRFFSDTDTINEKAINTLIDQFQKKYLWQIDLEKIEQESKQAIFRKRIGV